MSVKAKENFLELCRALRKFVFNLPFTVGLVVGFILGTIVNFTFGIVVSCILCLVTGFLSNCLWEKYKKLKRGKEPYWTASSVSDDMIRLECQIPATKKNTTVLLDTLKKTFTS